MVVSLDVLSIRNYGLETMQYFQNNSEIQLR